MDHEEHASFGVFKPIGHTVISFPGADQAAEARTALGRLGVAADEGFHWLIVHTPEDERARQVAACVKPLGAERAQLYGHFIIEDLITHADAPHPGGRIARPQAGLGRAIGARGRAR